MRLPLLLAVVVAASSLLATAPTSAQQSQGLIISGPQGGGGFSGVPTAGSHRSQRLQAEFRLEQMQIPGFTFWGARITDMDPSSPLHQAQFQINDVITRLDNKRITDSKWWDANINGWALPELETHFGQTEVRNIRTGTTRVRNDNVDLGPTWQISGGGGQIPGIIVP